MGNKQTAVEWLEEKLNGMILNGGSEDLLSVIVHIEQAKQMEKNQIMDAYFTGKYHGFEYDPEQYYNETYGK